MASGTINSKTNYVIPTLASNDDLNDYYKTGEYACMTTAISSTISNKPSEITGAFRFRVVCSSYDKGFGDAAAGCAQRIEWINHANPAIYIRYKENGGSFTSWYKFTGTAVT